MRAIPLSVLVVALLVPASSFAAKAQEATCTYATCALRMESSFLGTHIVRGAEGERVATVGLFGSQPRLSQLVLLSESAVRYAHTYEQKTPRGSLLLLSGLALATIPAFMEDSWSDEVRLGSGLAGVGLTLWGAITLAEAQRAIARSIWWYNGELPR